MASAVHIGALSCEIGLFGKWRDGVETGVAVNLIPGLDIAVAGFGMLGRDPEGYEHSGARSRKRTFDRSAECRYICDHMVRRHDEEDRVWVFGQRRMRGDGDGGGGVAPGGLQYEDRKSTRLNSSH